MERSSEYFDKEDDDDSDLEGSSDHEETAGPSTMSDGKISGWVIMKTSYFAKCGKFANAISIAGKAPSWYTGRQYKKLAPLYSFFKKYKEDGDEKYYTEQYFKEVLDKLDPQEVFNELGPNAILICYEAPGKFCHRRLVADWFSEKLGIDIPEYP